VLAALNDASLLLKSRAFEQSSGWMNEH